MENGPRFFRLHPQTQRSEVMRTASGVMPFFSWLSVLRDTTADFYDSAHYKKARLLFL